MGAFYAGASLGLSLIIAIGAQNAFVLKQGLQKRHVFAVCLLCALSDAILIIAGVFGFYLLTAQLPWLESAARYGGAAFLIAYGARSLYSALRTTDALQAAHGNQSRGNHSLIAAMSTTLAFTWLNPHVYLDTVVLLGSVSTQYPTAKTEFAAGASTASFVFFFALGYGARILAPLFAKPMAWKILDGMIAAVMWGIAVNLLRA